LVSVSFNFNVAPMSPTTNSSIEQGGGPNAGAAKQALDAVEWALGGAA
jgi:hypothetical protein